MHRFCKFIWGIHSVPPNLCQLGHSSSQAGRFQTQAKGSFLCVLSMATGPSLIFCFLSNAMYGLRRQFAWSCCWWRHPVFSSYAWARTCRDWSFIKLDHWQAGTFLTSSTRYWRFLIVLNLEEASSDSSPVEIHGGGVLLQDDVEGLKKVLRNAATSSLDGNVDL